MKYQVIVGNVGTVYDGNSLQDASTEYQDYIKLSRQNENSRAYQEDVTLIGDDDILYSYTAYNK